MNPLTMEKQYLNYGKHSGKCCEKPHKRIMDAAFCQAAEDIKVNESYRGQDASPLKSDRRLFILEDGKLVEPSMGEKNMFELLRTDKFFSLANDKYRVETI